MRSSGLTWLVLKAVSESEFVFANRKTGRSIGDVKNAFTQTCDKAGVPPDLHFHDLRHTAATRMAETGGAVDHQGYPRPFRYSDDRPLYACRRIPQASGA